MWKYSILDVLAFLENVSTVTILVFYMVNIIILYMLNIVSPGNSLRSGNLMFTNFVPHVLNIAMMMMIFLNIATMMMKMIFLSTQLQHILISRNLVMDGQTRVVSVSNLSYFHFPLKWSKAELLVSVELRLACCNINISRPCQSWEDGEDREQIPAVKVKKKTLFTVKEEVEDDKASAAWMHSLLKDILWFSVIVPAGICKKYGWIDSDAWFDHHL